MGVPNWEEARLSNVLPLMTGELQLLRRAMGWTQAQAADWCDIDRRTWGRWERLERQPEPVMRHYLRWLYARWLNQSLYAKPGQPAPVIGAPGDGSGGKNEDGGSGTAKRERQVPVIVPLPKSGGSNYTRPKPRRKGRK